MTTNGNESTPTRRVVLKRERVLVLPEGLTHDQIQGLINAVRAAKKGKAEVASAWVVVGEFEGASQTKAIEAHAGKPGTPNAKPGAYKAPAWSSWNGGELYEAPPAPLVQRRTLED